MMGIFIAVEGLDGSGGTTQTRRLAAWLRASGIGVLTTSEPSRLPVGALIRDALGRRVSIGDAVLPYLFAADRRDHLDREILPALDQGLVVISDRYLASSLAYQSMVMDFDGVAALNNVFPLPDLTVMLELTPEDCLQRIHVRGAARERFEELEALRRVEEGYRQALRWVEERDGAVAAVDGSLPEDAVAEAIRELVAPLLEPLD